MFTQIQNIPTPALFLKKGGGELFDLSPLVSVSLDSMPVILPIVNNAGTDPVTALVALTDMAGNGPQKVTFTDDIPPNASVKLDTMVNVTALPTTVSDPDATGSILLFSMINITPQSTGSLTEPDLTGGVVLTSIVA